MPEVTPQQVLDLPLGENDDSGQTTVRGYLVELLRLVWRDGEGFDGKRPFGNSGWEWDLSSVLAEAGMVAHTRDASGGLDFDAAEARGLIDAAIDALGAGPAGVWVAVDEDGDERPFASEAAAKESAGEYGRVRLFAWGEQING